ncbi:MFS domain-containing protein [Favolaschia claudopus]|uniref:MFS domain-containing protein n=1 Tax=Favolaschia claudopus TaxID=2862362 RepID=A0AAW0CK23_9AGAR
MATLSNTSTSGLAAPTVVELHVSPKESAPTSPANSAPPKGRAFWLTFLALMASTFLAALDLAAIGTALPTIAESLNDSEGNYIWVGSAYALSSTAFIPLSGNLADVFGRKSILLISVVFFTIGSALAGAAQNIDMMIAARTIQGIGGGGILTLTEIIVADLVPLAERGLYQGLLALVWAIASFSGPPIGGGLAQNGKAWRWLFYLNLPVGGIAIALVTFFLSVKRPEGSVREKLAKVDWGGNALIITATTLANIGLSWAGIRYPWDSAQVLAPLIIGLILFLVFAAYEAKIAVSPTVPRDLINNRTSISALSTTVVHSIVSICMVFYLPVFFQACFGSSPLRSAVQFLPATLTNTPIGFISVLLLTYFKRYREVNWISWIIVVVGFGLFSMIKEDSSAAMWAGFQVVIAAGVGPLFGVPMFALLAAVPTNRAASALALFSFTRAFSQTFGITISSTILQNELKKKLPAAFVAQFPPGFEIAYAAVPVIRTLPEPLRTEVRASFADSLRVVWQTMIGFAGLGLLLSLLMKEIPMHTTVDESYALQEKVKEGEVNVAEERKVDVEKQ